MAGNHVTVDTLGFLGEPLDEGSGVGDLALGFGQRLALLDGHQAAQVVLVFHQQFEPATQLVGAFLGGQRTPGRQSTLGGLDGAAGLGGAHLRHGADDFASGRVVDLDGLAAVGVQPGAVDIGLLAEQLGVFQLHLCLLHTGTTRVPGQVVVLRPVQDWPGRSRLERPGSWRGKGAFEISNES
ncbi:hypothetical protein D9M69_495980 [compost metagenome]